MTDAYAPWPRPGALTDHHAALRALRLIAATGCENYTGGFDCMGNPDRSPYATFTAGRWCDPCIARAGLDGTLPEETR